MKLLILLICANFGDKWVKELRQVEMMQVCNTFTLIVFDKRHSYFYAIEAILGFSGVAYIRHYCAFKICMEQKTRI